MPSYFDLYLDPIDNDYVYENGTFLTVNDIRAACRQRLFLRLNTWRGEWFLNTEYGVPYLQSILRKNVNKVDIDSIFIAEINNEPLVARIVSFQTELNKENRTYSGTLIVEVAEGDVINESSIPPNAELIYTRPDNTVATTPCEIVDIESANRLYAHINFNMGYDQSGTWWNMWK